MMRPIQTSLAALAAAAFLGGLVGSAAAQGGPTIKSMPLPPSASDPAPKGTGKAKPQKPAKKRADRGGAAASAGGGSSFDRPKSFVPEEFDRGGARDSGSGTRPMITPSGRPGMGMAF